jgi:hypothetical protein
LAKPLAFVPEAEMKAFFLKLAATDTNFTLEV